MLLSNVQYAPRAAPTAAITWGIIEAESAATTTTETVDEDEIPPTTLQ